MNDLTVEKREEKERKVRLKYKVANVPNLTIVPNLPIVPNVPTGQMC